ncbi:MAG: hypothetical protein K5637_02010 [Lachnospiraceae bacterium]|nr:hypothetical protein [Lachnospiraceae bacterium]
MNSKTFDILRYISEVVIQALVVFLGVVFANIPVAHSEAILAIVAAVGVFIGSLVNGWRKAYNAQDDGEAEG